MAQSPTPNQPRSAPRPQPKPKPQQRDEWQTLLDNVVGLLQGRDGPPAPIEERSVQRSPAARPTETARAPARPPPDKLALATPTPPAAPPVRGSPAPNRAPVASPAPLLVEPQVQANAAPAVARPVPSVETDRARESRTRRGAPGAGRRAAHAGRPRARHHRAAADRGRTTADENAAGSGASHYRAAGPASTGRRAGLLGDAGEASARGYRPACGRTSGAGGLACAVGRRARRASVAGAGGPRSLLRGLAQRKRVDSREQSRTGLRAPAAQRCATRARVGPRRARCNQRRVAGIRRESARSGHRGISRLPPPADLSGASGDGSPTHAARDRRQRLAPLHTIRRLGHAGGRQRACGNGRPMRYARTWPRSRSPTTSIAAAGRRSVPTRASASAFAFPFRRCCTVFVPFAAPTSTPPAHGRPTGTRPRARPACIEFRRLGGGARNAPASRKPGQIGRNTAVARLWTTRRIVRFVRCAAICAITSW